MRHFVLFLFSLCLLSPVSVMASPGGLDKNGCHTSKKTGDYHCHRKDGKTIPQDTKKDTGKKSSGTADKKKTSDKPVAPPQKSGSDTPKAPKTDSKPQ